MQAGISSASLLPAAPAPFALIAGNDFSTLPADAEVALRHMGLRPERLDVSGTSGEGAAFRLRLGDLYLTAAPAGDRAVARIDPAHPSTSSLAASLPADWRSGGRCWFFEPAPIGSEDEEKPSMRDFFMMASLLIDLFDASHFFWGPARLWSDAKQFRASTAEMLASGMPPVLHLIAFRQHDTGDAEIIRTRGLAHFGGQEMEAARPIGWTVADLVRRLARLSLDIIINGPVRGARRLPGLDPGEWISMAPRGSSEALLVEFGRNP
jgi:hypothetical protein